MDLETDVPLDLIGGLGAFPETCARRYSVRARKWLTDHIYAAIAMGKITGGPTSEALSTMNTYILM